MMALPKNEPIFSYEKGSKHRELLQTELKKLRSQFIDIPMYIDGKEVYTEQKRYIYPPHDIHHLIGKHSWGNASHAQKAIDAALRAKEAWMHTPWETKAAIFLKAAELISKKYRYTINAATMLCQSKNAFQAEIDAACELIDFLRFNVHYVNEIYADQPLSTDDTYNRLIYRPLEGFVFAITPFNFTAIAGNLAIAPALMGNTVVWKPADQQVYSAKVIMDILIESGLPAGVINLIYGDGPVIGKVVFTNPNFSGLHFTGSTSVFKNLWKQISNNLETYVNFPRIVGETGGKDFVLVHTSADTHQVVTALIRGAFEFQGQKCSAASRAYIPKSKWKEIKKKLLEEMKTIKVGGTENFTNFVNAVISEQAFDKITSYIIRAKEDGIEVMYGGNFSKETGYFIDPTILVTNDPLYITMREEIFGPVLTIYVYEDKKFDQVLELIDKTSIYALTGAILCRDTYVIEEVKKKLYYSAGNFYINDKPTGAVVGQQPFGGARASGTNDKAGSKLNLLRWVSPKTIKENLNPPADYRYPFLFS